MSQFDKLLEQAANNPKSVRFGDIDKLLRFARYERRQPGTGSSHYTYCKRGKPSLTIPRKKPYIGAVYAKKAIEAVLDYIDEK